MLTVAALATAVAIGVISQAPDEPQLRFDSSVAADFGDVAEEAWDRFLAAFPARLDCIGGITLVADYTLADRATYDPSRAQMVVRVPGPRVLLERAVAHELGHHLEFSCGAHRATRHAFLVALGRDPETPWSTGEDWEDIPSEVFAEAVVEVVFGDVSAVHPRIGSIPAEAVEVVRDWGRSH